MYGVVFFAGLDSPPFRLPCGAINASLPSGRQERNVPAQPLRETDYLVASRTMREFTAPEITRSDLQGLLTDLLPVFDAEDVSLTLNCDSSSDPRPGHPWFLHFDPSELMRGVAESPQGHRPMQALNQSGRRVMRVGDLPVAAQRAVLDSDYMKALEGQSGLLRVVAAHLGDRHGESLGVVGFLRARDHEEFDDERAYLLQTLHPALTVALRRILMRSVRDNEGGETALLNAAGQILWMTDGFRFLWNAVNSRPIPGRSLSPGSLLIAGATPLERTVAFQVILLATPDVQPGHLPSLAIRSGRPEGDITARFETVPGQGLGYVGRLLRVRLGRDNGDAA